MRRLLSRTSITVDEAIAILLGRGDGPIDYDLPDDSEEAEENCPVYCLQDDLEDERDVLAGEYAEARIEKRPAKFIDEKLAALRSHEALIEQANVHLCEIRDEINKGEQSMLRVDRSLSNAAYTYITLHSFNEWVKCRQGLAGVQPSEVVPAESAPSSAKGPEKKAPRTKLRDQEAAILKEIRRQGFDPMALPGNPFDGKSGVKKSVRSALQNLPLFEAKTSFKRAWEQLAGDGRIAYGGRTLLPTKT